MGLDPITTTVGLGIIAAGAIAALYLQESERENERRRCEKNSRRLKREARRRERELELEEQERIEEERKWEREEEARREEEREWEREQEARREEKRERRWEMKRRQEEAEERRRRSYALSNSMSDYDYRMASTSGYYPSQSYYYSFRNRSCSCDTCNPEQARSSTENSCGCGCESSEFNPFQNKKNSVSLTITPPQATQDKNQKQAKNQGSNNGPSASNSQGARTTKSSGSASKQNTNEPKASTSGSQQPRRNNNNNNDDNKKDDKDQDYGKLNDFMKKLKEVLDRCNASAELREKILSLFNKFDKHEDNFLRLLEDFRIQGIDIEDILLVVIRLFQSDYFAADIAYENLIALMEIVAKYIKDEVFLEMVEEGLKGNKKPFEEQRAECTKKVLQRTNILTAITELFEKIRKDIVRDNTERPLEIDFSGIFTKVYHYFKHKNVKGKEWTVTEYFDWIRTLLTLLKDLKPEYVELTDVTHPRREIVFEVYSTVFQGRFRIVIRAYGPLLRICTFFLKGRYDKKAKDGDKYVDGKKKP